LTGAVLEKSFKTSEKFEEPDVQLSPASFLYSDGAGFHFMDEESYEHFAFDAEQLGDDRLYLKDGLSLHVLIYNVYPVSLQLPNFGELAGTVSARGVRGDTASGGTTKQATL